MQEYVDVCDAVNPTHCVPFELCALHMQHTIVHHVLKTAPQFINHLKKREANSKRCSLFTLHKHSALLVALLCTWSFFTVYYNSILCWFSEEEKTGELESALEKLMWGEERAESKYVNIPSHLCACMRVMKENERRENQINL